MARTRSGRGRGRQPSPARSESELGAESQALLNIITQRFQVQNQQIESLVTRIEQLSSNQTVPKESPATSSGGEDVATDDSASNLITNKDKEDSDIHVVKTISYQHPHNHGKRNLARFSGKDASLHVDAWLRTFEVIMHHQPDAEKKFEVAQFLDGDALTWFANHIIQNLDALSWSQVKESLIERFKVHELRPLVAAQDRYLQKNETVQKYFDDKMRLLQQTNLPEEDKVALLSRGMPHFYKPHLICADIKTPSKWLSTNLELESSFKRTMAFKRPQSSAPAQEFKVMAATNDKKVKKEEKKANACRICMRKGINDQLHWHSECPNRDPNWESKKKVETCNTAKSKN